MRALVAPRFSIRSVPWIASLIGFSLMGAEPSLAQVRFRYEPIGLPVEGSVEFAAVRDLDDEGRVLGAYLDLDQASRLQPFVWAAGSVVFPSIGTGQEKVEPLAFGASGDFVGTIDDGVLLSTEHGFLRRSNGAVVEIPPLAGDDESRPSAMNGSGLVVGRSGGIGGTPFLWQESLGSVPIATGALSGALPQDVNEASVVVGSADSTSGWQVAFRWEAGAIVELPVLPAAVEGSALAINESGTIVGRSGKQAVLWSNPFTVVDLGSLGAGTRALGLNENEQVVGTIFAAPGTVLSDPIGGFFWSDESGILDLAGLIDPTTPADVVRAAAINATGQIAVEVDVAGIVQAGLLTPSGRIRWIGVDGGNLLDAAKWERPLGFEVANPHLDHVVAPAAVQTLALDTTLLANRLQIGDAARPTTLSLSDSAVVDTAEGTHVSVGSILDAGGRMLGGFTNRGTLRVGSARRLEIDGDVELISGSALEIEIGGELVLSGDVTIRPGVVSRGEGLRRFEGSLAIGDSPGLYADAGNILFAPEHRLRIEIGSTAQGLRADRLVAQGAIELDGFLELASFGGHVAQIGEQYDLIDAGSTTGRFRSIDSTGLTLAADARLDLGRLQEEGIVAIVPLPEPMTGASALAGVAWLTGLVRRRRAR